MLTEPYSRIRFQICYDPSRSVIMGEVDMNGRQSDLGKKVAANYNQEFEGTIEGPHRLGQYSVSRVWTHDEEHDEFHAHYVVEDGPKLRYFENFSPFAIWLSDQFNLDYAALRRDQFIRTVVASVVVLGAFGVFAYATIQNPSATPIGYIATAVVGGGAGLLFGRR